MGRSLNLGRSVRFEAEVEEKVKGLKLEEVNAALRKYLRPTSFVVLKAGDFTKAPK